MTGRDRIAVVGSGVSGLTAAYLLGRHYEVTLLESEHRLGGHAHTHDVDGPEGPMAVDSGFIVCNDRTYPLFRRLLSELGVSTRPTEMSMSVREEDTGIEYAGGRGARGFLARPRQWFGRDYPSMLVGVRRFHALAQRFLDETDDEDGTTLGEFVRQGRFSAAFVRLYAVPVVACVWSTGGADALDYPARYLFRFLAHHGMLSVGDSPTWHTVVGGSRAYVQAVARGIADVRVGRAVVSVVRRAEGVELRLQDGSTERVDRVVIATHADRALALLADPSPAEREVLGAFGYTRNEVLLHRDPSLMPRTAGTRSSWNYLVRGAGTEPPLVTYWMNRLQGLPTSAPVYVTLNGASRIRPDLVIDAVTYDHPRYDLAAIRAQRRLAELSRGRTAYAGAYHGWGFHEDGVRSGVAAAAAFGVSW
ncbi:MAG: FAD-dependent oxidoreductase [Dermatophilaceae bacterium]